MKNLAVFCSSSNALDNRFYNFAEVFARQMAIEGYNLVYGGANVGMMKHIAETVKKNGGKIIGVIPKAFAQRGLVEEKADEIIIVLDLHERKKKIVEMSYGFVALPGGFGTLDELLEVIVLKQLAFIDGPIVILNFDVFFDNIIKQFDLIFENKFAKPHIKDLYYVASCVDEVFDYLRFYEPNLDKDWHKVNREDFKK